MKDLFAQFLKEKEFLANLSSKTLRSYQQAFNAYQRVLSARGLPTADAALSITKDSLKDFVVQFRPCLGELSTRQNK